MAYEKRIQLLLPEQLQKEIIARNTVSEAVRTSLERYFYLIREARKTLKRKFSIDEIRFLCDVFNDFNSIVHNDVLVQQFKAISPDLKIKWGFKESEEEELLKRLITLSLVERASLFDVIERFWKATETGMKIDCSGLLD